MKGTLLGHKHLQTCAKYSHTLLPPWSQATMEENKRELTMKCRARGSNVCDCIFMILRCVILRIPYVASSPLKGSAAGQEKYRMASYPDLEEIHLWRTRANLAL